MAEQGYPKEMFECAPSVRLDAHERVASLRNHQLECEMKRLEEMMERLERRLWLTVYGVVGVVLAQAFQSILDALP